MIPVAQSTLRRFVNRYASFAGARIALVIGRWFVLVQSARHLPTADFAALAAALSIAEILRALSDVGVDGFAYSRLGNARQRLRNTVRSALLFRFAIASALTVAGGLVYAEITADLRLIPVFALILASTLQSTSVALLQKSSRFGTIVILVAVTLAASLAVDVAVLFTPVTLSVMAVLLVLPDLAAALTASLLARAAIATLVCAARQSRRTLLNQLRPIAGKLLPGATVAVVVMAYSRLDVVIVRPFAGTLAQAHYSAGFRLVEPVFLFFAIASLALLAELGSSRSANTQSLGSRIIGISRYRLLMILTLASIGSAITAMLLARHLIGLSVEVSNLTGLFAAAIPFRFGNSMVSALLLRLGRFDAVMYAAFVDGGITFGLAFVLVKLHGAHGAALAALIGEVANTVFQRRALKQQLTIETGRSISLATA